MAMVSSRLVFLFSICILISQAFALQRYFLYYNCSDNGNYTSNSTYKANLNRVLYSLSSNTEINYGFYNFSFGKSPDQVYSIGLCRGDVNPDICLSCLKNATNLLTLLCPTQKEAIGGFDYCLLRYSFSDIFSKMVGSPAFVMRNVDNVSSNYDQFRQDLTTLLGRKISEAAAGGSRKKFAVGKTAAPDSQTLYSLAQCTPDLSVQDCRDCLNATATELLPNCCDGRQGGRVVRPSCSLRYEIYLFYNATADNASSPSLSPPPPPVPSVTPPVPSVSPPASNNTPAAEGESVDEIRSVESLQLGFGTIKVATDDFSDANKLGQGGFGVVYKGKFSDGQVIAVKRLSKNSSQGDLEFKNEVLLVAKLQHRNLVRLLGFCLEGIERLLIYEFVPNGSLYNFIFDPIKCVQLDWARHYKIIGGIARGLLYLHEDSRLRIIHRDLKTSNILLDSEMNPKISDFGMARLFELDQSEGNTSRIVGTYGYMPPEYAMHGQFSIKSDVFSFGVLVLEIISGRKNSSFQNGENIENLLSYAWKNWKQGIFSNLVNPTLKAGSTTEIMRCIHIGLLCVQENIAHRPTMASVVLMLNSYSITLPIPSEPAFFMNNSTESNICLQWEHDSSVVESNQSKRSSVQDSINEVSITEQSPR